jgi:hypothetical protein
VENGEVYLTVRAFEDDFGPNDFDGLILHEMYHLLNPGVDTHLSQAQINKDCDTTFQN